MTSAMCAGGTIMSGLVGLLFRVLLGHKAWIARPLAVATSVGLLAVTASPFPPGEACTTSKPCPQHTSTCVHMHACVRACVRVCVCVCTCVRACVRGYVSLQRPGSVYKHAVPHS